MFLQITSIPTLIERYHTRYNVCQITGLNERTVEKYSTDVHMISHCILNGKLMTHDKRSRSVLLPEDAPKPKRGRKAMQLDDVTINLRTCKHGHPRTAENIYIHKKTGYVQCRVCRRLWAQAAK